MGPWSSSREPERPKESLRGDAAAEEKYGEPATSLKQLKNRKVLWKDAFKKWTPKLKGKMVT